METGKGRECLDWLYRTCSIDSSSQSFDGEIRTKRLRRKVQAESPTKVHFVPSYSVNQREIKRKGTDFALLKARISLKSSRIAYFKLTYTCECLKNAEEIDSLQAILPVVANIDRIWKRLGKVQGLGCDLALIASYSSLYNQLLRLLHLKACPPLSSPYELLTAVLSTFHLGDNSVKQLYSTQVEYTIICRKCAKKRVITRSMGGVEVNAVGNCLIEGEIARFERGDFFSEGIGSNTAAEMLKYAENMHQEIGLNQQSETNLQVALQYALRTYALLLPCGKCHVETSHFQFTRIATFAPVLLLHIPPSKARIPIHIPSAFSLQGQKYSLRGLILRIPSFAACRYQSLLYRRDAWSCLTPAGLQPYASSCFPNPHLLIYLTSP